MAERKGLFGPGTLTPAGPPSLALRRSLALTVLESNPGGFC